MAGIDPNTQHKDGKWKKGCSGNPSGVRDSSNFNKILSSLFTDEYMAYILYCKTHGINTNISVNADLVKLISDQEVKKDFRKYLRKIKPNGKFDARTGQARLSDRDQVAVIEWVSDRLYGKAVQQIKADVETNITNITIDLPENLNKEDF